MSQDDPFSVFDDEDKTIVRPSPGGRRRTAQLPPTIPEAVPKVHGLDVTRLGGIGENPLISGAASLFSVVSRLRSTGVQKDPGELQRKLAAEIRDFETQILRQGIPQEHVRKASYAICSLLDETVLNTPWGAQSHWGHQSLLVLFHKEAWGGEKFFEMLRELVQRPVENLNLLEFFFLCLSLGFEGKYRIAQGGANALENMRGELFNLIQRLRGDPERELSPRWQGLRDLRPALIRYVPLWVVGASLAAVLVLVYVGFLLAINGASDPLFRQITALSNEKFGVEEPVVPTVRMTGRAERFRPLLAEEIAQGLVEVADDHTLRIHNSFASGSDRLKPEFVPMLKKIAQELEAGGDRVVVSGHTDDKPIRSVRFPSNFDLSSARARNVADLLLASAHLTGKIRFEGRADGEPLVPNDTPEHRAINRRVDILIK